MKIYVFGSDLSGDHMARKVAKELKEHLSHDFVFTNDPTDLLYEHELVVMDAVKGITKVRVFQNPQEFYATKICSLHDFDLGYFLQLSERLQLKKKITIIGVPMKGRYEEIRDQVTDSLQQLQEPSFRFSVRHAL